MAKHRVKTVTTQLNAVWEMVEAGMFLDLIKHRKPTREEMITMYRGNFIPCVYDQRVNENCVWKLHLEVIYLDLNNEEQTDTMTWEFGTPMTFKEMLTGKSDYLVKEAGLTTVWQGVTHEWKNYVKRNLKGVDPISAWVTASTTSQVKPLTFMHRHSHFASDLNKDFRTGKYLL